jgi:acetylornithine deacetylase/succinyl-diaminopimelate desuccinylase-like protein
VQGLVVQLREKHPDYGIEFETFVSVPGAEISGDHEMIKAIEACHQQVLGRAPQHGTVVWSSDASVLTRYGIETVNYGPSSGPRDAEGEKVRIQALVDVTKIYALAAAQLCGAR